MNHVTTPVFRVSFPNVFKPKLNDLSNKQEYSLVALFSKGADLKVLKEAAEAALVKKWGKDKSKWPINLRTPFRKQEERMKEGVLPAGHEEGGIFINLKSPQKPGIVEPFADPLNPLMPMIMTDESHFYAGCYAMATVNAYAYDQKGNRGVSFGLGNIQKVKDGESLGGRSRAIDDFAPLTFDEVDGNLGDAAETAGSDLF